MSSLAAAYAQVPTMHCKGLCVDSCHSVGITPAEQARIRLLHGLTIEAGYYPDGCPALDAGRCTIYADRPLVCRLWGTVPTMVCPHGCTPVVALTDARGRELLASIWEEGPA